MALTVGDLTAAHLGRPFTLTPPDEPTGPRTSQLVRVQHNAPSHDSLGQPYPAQTLLVLGAWSGALPPTHPIIEEVEPRG